MTKKIPLTQGKFALVDDEDYEYLMQWKWYAGKDTRTFYARRSVGPRNKKSAILMHRLVINASNGSKVDHIDGNGLNNQKQNLRICSDSGNAQNSCVRKDNTTGYKGVSFRRNIGKYVASIFANGKAHHLGYYDTPEEAARKYDKAARKFFGIFAKLNFPR